MPSALARHSFAAVLLAVVIEELGIPMPIPTDVLIVFSGTEAGGSIARLSPLFVVLAMASTVGASGLYAIVRYGGRPLVERFGRYVHLGPKQLAKSEALLARGGWGGIALGRAIPGVRYATVVACGLLKVPYPRFVTAQLAGSSVYIASFLALGAVFGPKVLRLIHLPALSIRLFWLVLLAVGLPLVVIWWGSRAHVRRRLATPSSRRRALGAALLGSFVGTTALAAAWSLVATGAELSDAAHPFLESLGLEAYGQGASLPLYVALLALFVPLCAAYYEVLLPCLGLRGVSPIRQTLGLSLLALCLFGTAYVLVVAVAQDEAFEPSWWRTGGPLMLLADALGVVICTLTTVYSRALAIAVMPSPPLLRRNGAS